MPLLYDVFITDCRYFDFLLSFFFVFSPISADAAIDTIRDVLSLIADYHY